MLCPFFDGNSVQIARRLSSNSVRMRILQISAGAIFVFIREVKIAVAPCRSPASLFSCACGAHFYDLCMSVRTSDVRVQVVVSSIRKSGALIIVKSRLS